VAVRIGLVLALVVVMIAVQVKYCRCPKCDQNPGPKGPRSGAPAHVRNSPRFDMENWETCLKCGAELRWRDGAPTNHGGGQLVGIFDDDKTALTRSRLANDHKEALVGAV
jgi:hypothetical protein